MQVAVSAAVSAPSVVLVFACVEAHSCVITLLHVVTAGLDGKGRYGMRWAATSACAPTCHNAHPNHAL
jgi:hypothetical protein